MPANSNVCVVIKCWQVTCKNEGAKNFLKRGFIIIIIIVIITITIINIMIP